MTIAIDFSNRLRSGDMAQVRVAADTARDFSMAYLTIESAIVAPNPTECPIIGSPEAVAGQVAESSSGKTLGLALDEDLINLRLTGAVTYENRGWQNAGLTTVDFGRMSEPAWFQQAFREASENADAIRFDVSSFVVGHEKSNITAWELSQIVNNPSLLTKTTFVQNGTKVVWNGTGFVKP